MPTELECISLHTVPGIQQRFQRLYGMVNLPFEGNSLTLMKVEELVDTLQRRLHGVEDELVPKPIITHIGGSRASHKKALVITDLGIVRHQIRLMLSQQHIEVMAADATAEVAKLLETNDFNYVVLELPYQSTSDGQDALQLPKVLNYLIDFKQSMESNLAIIVILNRKDPRMGNVEQLATHMIIKDAGWQHHLGLILRQTGS